jgi:FtsH-binding integral membrane protein
MNNFGFSSHAGAGAITGRNAVVRNTCLLLALSLIPTVLGALIGVAFLPMSLFSGLVGMLLFLTVAWGLIYAIQKNKNSGWGVGFLLAFTFFMGVMLSGILTHTLRFANGGSLIAIACLGTALIVVAMAGVASTSTKDFSSIGKWAFIGLIAIIVASIANIFLKMPLLHALLAAAATVVFSAYLLYDVQRVVKGGETNYIVASLSIYLDIYNIFTSVLDLLGISIGERK